MTTSRVLKGFTVPQGYSLTIIQEDGTAIEKQPGEYSGGNYSFEQVMQGIDQDWQLSEVAQQETAPQPEYTPPNIHPHYSRPEITAKRTEYLNILNRIETRTVSELVEQGMNKEVAEILDLLPRELNKELFPYEDEHIISKQEFLALTPEDLVEKLVAIDSDLFSHEQGLKFDEGAVLIRDSVNRALKFSPSVHNKPPEPSSYGTLGYLAASLYENFTPVERFDEALSLLRKKLSHELRTPEEVEDELPEDELIRVIEDTLQMVPIDAKKEPSFYHVVEKRERLANIINSYKNPTNVRRIFSGLYQHTEHRIKEQIEPKIAELNKEMDDYHAANITPIKEELSELDKRIVELDTQYPELLGGLYEGEEHPRPVPKEVEKEYNDLMNRYNALEITKAKASSHIMDINERVVQLQYRIQSTCEEQVDKYFSGVIAGEVDHSEKYLVNDEDTKQLAVSPERKNIANNIRNGSRFVTGFVHNDIYKELREHVSKVSSNYYNDTDSIIDNHISPFNIRASCSGTTLNLSNDSSLSTVVHEMGHAVENLSPSVRLAVMRFLVNNIGQNDTSGILAAATGKSYDPDETFFADGFKRESYYAGKIYTHSGVYGTNQAYPFGTFEKAVKGLRATEIVSMGLQLMHDAPSKFAADMPDFFELIWSLRSNPTIVRKKDEVVSDSPGKIEMKSVINVIKGFTVPQGYSLSIMQEDGTAIEKQPGEYSGGQYSFEQVQQGIDPDWQLNEQGQAQQQDGHQVQIEEGQLAFEQLPAELQRLHPKLEGRFDIIQNGNEFTYVMQGMEGWETAARTIELDDGEVVSDNKHISYYNPDIAEAIPTIFEGELNDGRKYKLKDFKTELKPGWSDEIVDDTPGMMYRGMSYEEWENAQKTGYLQSAGTYNIGSEQEGLTYYSSEIDSAAYYANNFSPTQFKATPKKPAIVVAVPIREGVQVGGTGKDEIGIPDRIPISEITNMWEGLPYYHKPGNASVNEDYRGPIVGSASSPSVAVVWKKLEDQGRMLESKLPGSKTSPQPTPATPSSPAGSAITPSIESAVLGVKTKLAQAIVAGKKLSRIGMHLETALAWNSLSESDRQQLELDDMLADIFSYRLDRPQLPNKLGTEFELKDVFPHYQDGKVSVQGMRKLLVRAGSPEDLANAFAQLPAPGDFTHDDERIFIEEELQLLQDELEEAKNNGYEYSDHIQRISELKAQQAALSTTVTSAFREAISAKRNANASGRFAVDYTLTNGRAHGLIQDNLDSAFAFVSGFFHKAYQPPGKGNLVFINNEPNRGRDGYTTFRGIPMILTSAFSAVGLVHELGHHYETTSSKIQHRSAEFLAKRIKPTDRLELVSDLKNDPRYEPTEVAFRDDFTLEAYCGRVYSIGGAGKKGKPLSDVALYIDSTELISQGVEMLYENPVKFAREDPDYFKFIMGFRWAVRERGQTT